MTLTFGSLFAGIGGIDLGLERAGMTCRWQVEISPFCQRVLAKHWPDVRRYEDVRDCGKHNLETVDLVCGGFPCQPHSYAGKRKGKADDRNLWPEYRRIIAELRPRWVLGENVPGIRTTMLDEVLSDLDGLAYTTGTLIVPACAFDAPHRRERVFIVAHNVYGEPPQGNSSTALHRQTTNERRETDQDSIFVGSGSTVADTQGQLCNGGDDHARERVERRQVSQPRDNSGTANVADTENTDRRRPDDTKHPGRGHPQTGGCGITSGGVQYWATEPDVGRVAHGVPNRVDRLRALGNAVVPQVAEWLGRQILEAHSRP